MENKSEKFDTVIRSKSGLFEVDLKEIIKYRDLIWLFVKRNFTIQYKQTILGPAWAVIEPLLTTVIFNLIFGTIAGLPTDGVNSFLFYMCGNVAWHYFQMCLVKTSQTFIQNSKIFGKVYFPRLTVPISIVLTNLINFFIQALFFLCFLAYFLLIGDKTIHVNPLLMLLSPVFILEMALMAMGFGMIISALTTKYKDLQMLVSFGVQLWMYATPVAYPSSMISTNYPQLKTLFMLNPMTSVVEYFRAAFLGAGSFSYMWWGVSLLTTALIVFLGVILFNKTEKNFMDTI